MTFVDFQRKKPENNWTPKRESVMALMDIFQSVKTYIGREKLRYCVKDQSSIRRDWVCLA